MTKQTIEVEVPEGWKVKEYRIPNKGDYFWHQNRVCVASSSFIDQRLIIEKIKPRRIVLEETGEVNNKLNAPHRNIFDGVQIFTDEKADVCLKVIGEKIWREVVEQVNEETK